MSAHPQRPAGEARLDITLDASNISLSEILNSRIAELRTKQIRNQAFPTLPGITQTEEFEMRLADRLILGPMDPSWRDGLAEQELSSHEVIARVLRDTYARTYAQWREWARAYITTQATFEQDFQQAWQRVATIISEFRSR